MTRYAKDENGRFLSGNIGGGRPKGSRNKLSEAFVEAMYADWQEHGVDAIRRVREEKPDQYLKVIASLVPRDLNVNLNEFEGLTNEDLRDELRGIVRSISALGIDLDDDDDGEEPAH